MVRRYAHLSADHLTPYAAQLRLSQNGGMPVAETPCATARHKAVTRRGSRKPKRDQTLRSDPSYMVRLAGIEPTTPWFVAKYSIQLSYSRERQNYSTHSINFGSPFGIEFYSTLSRLPAAHLLSSGRALPSSTAAAHLSTYLTATCKDTVGNAYYHELRRYSERVGMIFLKMEKLIWQASSRAASATSYPKGAIRTA